MKSRLILTLIFASCYFAAVHATNYYINDAIGNNQQKGTNAKIPWKTVEPLTAIALMPGDSVLFANGQSFRGQLSLIKVTGTAKQHIFIGGYAYKGNRQKPHIDAGTDLYGVYVQDASFLDINGLEITATIPLREKAVAKKDEMRCGIFVEVIGNNLYENISIKNVQVHDVQLMVPGFVITAAETKTANGTLGYGWGIRAINNSASGILLKMEVLNTEIFNVSHTGLKLTGRTNSIQKATIAYCKVRQTGGPGMQFSGITDGHIHHNIIDHSGSKADSRNWGRGSGLWTWGCSNVLIEYNRFEHANGPGDSAGVHIDYNCNDVVVQYNLSANNAGGFCEILGNNFNCAYRYNISINDGYRVKGVNGAFQEGKTFWLSGYQGDQKKSAGPYNSYFYNNTIYVSNSITPKIAVSSSANGVLICNNIFYFEKPAQIVAGDQKKVEVDLDGIPNVFFSNNLFLHTRDWPTDFSLQDKAPMVGEPGFSKKGGLELKDYVPGNKSLLRNKGIEIPILPNDSIGLRIGLKVTKDILGNTISKEPDMGAIELR